MYVYMYMRIYMHTYTHTHTHIPEHKSAQYTHKYPLTPKNAHITTHTQVCLTLQHIKANSLQRHFACTTLTQATGTRT